MKLMHISDLHLGTSLYDTDITSDIEHALFSEILGRIYREVSAQGRIDGLIIAGDVFDKAQPPAYAEEIYGRLILDKFLDQPGLSDAPPAVDHNKTAVTTVFLFQRLQFTLPSYKFHFGSRPLI